MQIDNVPGLTIHQHEGKLAGAFDLPPASLANLLYDGRVMLVIVADVGSPFNVTTAKDGTHTAHWTFKAADAAIVNTDSMRDLLTDTYSLEGADAITPPQLNFDGEDDGFEGVGMPGDFPDDPAAEPLLSSEEEQILEEIQEQIEHAIGLPDSIKERLGKTPTVAPVREAETFEPARRGPRDEKLEAFLYE